MSRTTIDELLAAARERIDRVDPQTAESAVRNGDAIVVDIRAEGQIARDGVVPGAIVIGRNVLEWRLDPDCEYRHTDAPGLDRRVIVMCNEGYQSSLAAVTLQELGFSRATDMAGGFQAWRAAGLPVAPGLP